MIKIRKLLLRKICALLAAFSMIAAIPLPLAYAEEISDGTLTLLNQLNIMVGDPSGDLRLYDTVTRAEFTKAAIAASSYKNSVATYLSISPFFDVTYQHWAAPYVRVGVSNGLISGYPDASFRPDDEVLFEEGITIMLRVLGYTDDDFGASWPYGQIGLANNLDITDDIDCSVGQSMNRSQVAQLIYNTLKTKQKGQSSQLISIFDVEIKEDITLIADSSSDSSIASDEIYTSSGTLKIEDTFDRSCIGLSGDVAVKNSNKIIAFIPDSGSLESEEYIVYSVLSDSIMAYYNGNLSQLNIADNITVYKGKTQTTFAGIKASLELGDILKIKKTDNIIDYITWQDGNVIGPATVYTSNWSLSWNIDENTKIMRNGSSSSISALQIYDIAYFLPDLNMVLAYSDKVTGIYQSASPNKDMPTSITISGKSYTLEGSTAFSKLASGGSFELGDTITALIGKDGSIADVVSPGAEAGGNLVGYLLDTGRKEFQSGTLNSYNSYYVSIVLPDGTPVEYATNIDYSAGKNKIVEVTFTDGYATCSVINSNQTISGTFNWSAKRFGSKSIASDISILDIGTIDSNYTGIYTAIYPQRLDGVSISSSQVLYYETNSSGEINKLILNDVTGDAYSYGFMISSQQNSDSLSGTYQYIVDGQLYNLNTNGRILNIGSNIAIKISGNASNPNYVSKLNEVSGKIKSVTADKVITSSKSYSISPDVAVYQKNYSFTNTYIKIPISDIIGKTDLSMSAFYDKEESSGGKIRIIIIY